MFPLKGNLYFTENKGEKTIVPVVPLISVALNAMGSFSAPIYLLEPSTLLNIAKVFLILFFFSKKPTHCFVNSVLILYFIIPILLLTLNLFLF